MAKKLSRMFILCLALLVTLIQGGSTQSLLPETKSIFNSKKLSKLKNYAYQMSFQGDLSEELAGKEEIAAKYHDDENYEITETGKSKAGKTHPLLNQYILANGHYYKKEAFESALLKDIPEEPKSIEWIDLGTRLFYEDKFAFEPFAGLWETMMQGYIALGTPKPAVSSCSQAGRNGKLYKIETKLPKEVEPDQKGTFSGTVCVDAQTEAPLASHIILNATKTVDGRLIPQHQSFDFIVTQVGGIPRILPPTGAKQEESDTGD